MAKAYCFDYCSHLSGHFKNGTVEANSVGAVFTNCVFDTLIEYGVRVKGLPRPYKSTYYQAADRFRSSIFYDDEGLLEVIDISLTKDGKLVIDFGREQIISENSNDEIVQEIRKKAINKYLIDIDSPTYTTKSINKRGKDHGCYVATAVYGSYDCPEVWILRRFRDFFLKEKWYGRVFIGFYYAISPTIVKYFGQSKWFKWFWKSKLDYLVSLLKTKGFKDDPYND